VVEQKLAMEINLPPEELIQFVGAIGAAALGHRRLKKLQVAPAVERHGG
jgi:activator of 2-hydroxyglutaryl-CoA dehydratase